MNRLARGKAVRFKDAGKNLAEFSYCCRAPDVGRMQSEKGSYKKGHEARLRLTSPAALSGVRRYLEAHGVRCGSPYVQQAGHSGWVLPLYGQLNVEAFEALLAVPRPRKLASKRVKRVRPVTTGTRSR
jgi:hypothetical protein